MSTTVPPAKDDNERIPDRKPWRTPHFVALADVHDTSKPFSFADTGTFGPS